MELNVCIKIRYKTHPLKVALGWNKETRIMKLTGVNVLPAFMRLYNYCACHNKITDYEKGEGKYASKTGRRLSICTN